MQEIRKNLKDLEILRSTRNFKLFYRRHTLYAIKNHENSQCDWRNLQAFSSMGEVYTTVKNTYNKIAPHFDATRQKTWKEVEKFIDSQPKGTLLLDLASGTGRHALYAENQGLNPVAGDFSISQLRQLRKKDKPIPLIILDLLNLPFKNHTFDSVIYIAAIHHLETEKSRIESLREADRILKPGSDLLVSAWALDQSRFKNKATYGDIHYLWDKKYPRFYHLFRAKELDDIVKKADISVVDSYRIKDNIYVRSRTKDQ
ncbi:MAG: class I SAM-dependent methyltransferase [archaeon]|nr:class I SAM-dependent methyltransferase [archaeon]